MGGIVTHETGANRMKILTGFFLVVSLLNGIAKASEVPESFSARTEPFYLVCSTPSELRDVLLSVHNEIPLVAGWLETGNQWLIYVSEDNSSMSFVVHKTDGEACIVWSGKSDGKAYVPNPAPKWPEYDIPPTKESMNEGWNIRG